MELSRRKVPLYGQAKVFTLLEGLDSVPEDAEVYVVLEGSTLVHVTRAHSDIMLCFIVPGHNMAEMVSVQAYLFSESTGLMWVGGASLEYVQDDAQDLAEHLIIHGHRLRATDHEELSNLFSLGPGSSRWAMDRCIALAMANLDIPHSWNVLGSQSEHNRRESPLHLAVRFGLCRLAELLLCQPGGLMAISLPNEEGVTPLQLAQTTGNSELLELLTHPPNPLTTPPAGLSQVWADHSRLLRFCHDTKNLTLTVRQNLRWSSEESRHADILLLRDRLHDEDFLREIMALRREKVESVLEKEQLVDDPVENALYPDIEEGNMVPTKNEDIFDYEESLMFSLNEENEDDTLHSDSEKSQSIKEASSPTLSAAARLSAMIHGKDGEFANGKLVDDLDIKYHSPNEGSRPGWDSFFGTPSNTETCSYPASPPAEARDPQGTGLKKPPTSPFTSSPVFPSSPLASAFHLFEGGHKRTSHTVSPRVNYRGYSFSDRTRDLSPSLECDSEEEDILGHSYPIASLRKQASLRSSSGEERDSFDTSPDAERTHSDNNSAKGPEEAEVRLRSYSYSSPKAKPSRPLLNRDATISDPTEEQRAFSLTETPSREKRILGFRKRAQSAEEESSASLQHLTLTEFLKEIEDEEWDRYIIPSKAESEKYKVSRTFSFLKSRMTSTRSKTKVKGKEVKEMKEKGTAVNGHQFSPMSPSGSALCVACDKFVSGKELLHCSNCFLKVHKSCREFSMACVKKQSEKNALLMKSKTLSLPLNSTKDSVSLFSPSSISTTTKDKREPVAQLSKSMSISIDSRQLHEKLVVEEESSQSPGVTSSVTDEGASVTPLSSDHLLVITQDALGGSLLGDLSADQLGLDAESWSLAVSPDFCRQHERFTVKRQDVIYELLQTELHHIQTLTVMSEVFRRGMLEELQLDLDCVARMFPCLDLLIHFHKNLFGALQERRQASAQLHHPRNYLIHSIGDILLQQFSDENAEKMKQMYGEFCSHHKEAVNIFKDLQQQNKKLQNFVKQQSNNILVKRREVPEFILLVTQRITKYPVLLERILQYTKQGSQEYQDLSSALVHIRDIISAVDMTVNKYEKSQELQEVLTRLENKSIAKLKNDKVFSKQDLCSKHRVLQHKGLVYWKTATGRLKDTLALLLTDVLVFLQEKDQRFTFAAVDQKPPVIPLQKLIVREVANEERGMFLISASSVGPEMYEVHTISREERNAWMRQIRQAVESCPEEEEQEERSNESEETKRATEARIQKITHFQDTLLAQDQMICNTLEEKLELYAELTELSLGSLEPIPHRHLLVQADSDTPRLATTLLTAALKEAENLMSVLQSRDGATVQSPHCAGLESNSEDSVQDVPSEPDYLSTLSISSSCLGSDSDLTDEWSTEPKRGEAKNTLIKVAESVQSLTQLLYSLQATVSLQDSCCEIQKLLLQEGELTPLRALPSLQNTEQEKPKTSDKKKEDVEKKKESDEVQKLHLKLKQEQQRWDKECLAREKQQSDQENELRQREQQCLLEAERLRCEREEFEIQLLEYQQNMDRLKEGQRSVEREREKIEAQQRLLQSWRHNRQSSLPITIPPQHYQVPSHTHSGSLDGNCRMYENETVLLTTLQQSHLYQSAHNHHQSLLSAPKRIQNGPLSSSGYSTNLGLSASLYNSLNTLLSQAHNRQMSDRLTYTNCSYNSTQPISESMHSISSRVQTQPPKPTNFSPPRGRQSLESWSSEVTSDGLYEEDYSSSPSLTPLLPPQAYLSLEGPNGDDGGEENIVYL
ncbi:rho guanine nucleotide exchange factor 28-like [Boleophthalmus pectinirostris]|uniref:rho guanine nucleotide exchange factor 28-like n=1 Tax=Boleophthalmus pectinirostris TaxID=150288 RepID=UPI00242AF749|nr:rho guanine nucleotide exchange factor 28-like [Boleophthalmus pectinirostris]